jgi:4-aminobutyrate aminotransferase/(S)-3-amino-2-methylpropionate transaminase
MHPAVVIPSGTELPSVRTALPGPLGRALVDALADHECPGLTARRRRRAEATGASHDPVVWSAARGANVTDVDGNVYVDLTAGFGAALIGHTHPRVVAAVRAQSERMLHALGDVYPSDVKIALEQRLAAMAPWPARVILGLSGADAVEAGLKTARLHTGRAGVLAFEGAYHGLSYGTVAACGYREAFRVPFAGQLNPAVRFAPYPARVEDAAASLRAVDEALASGAIGAVLVEPMLGRGGVVVPPPGFLTALAERAKQAGAALVVDEIYTGLHRTGARFRAVAEGCTPDVICLGKALGGGLPVSACLIREDVARAWGASVGEAIHTSTFLGNPLACAAAMAALDVLDAPETHAEITRAAATLARVLHSTGLPVTAVGLLAAVRFGAPGRAIGVMRALLERGYVVLPGGADADALTLTPPCGVTDAQLEGFGTALRDVLAG